MRSGWLLSADLILGVIRCGMAERLTILAPPSFVLRLFDELSADRAAAFEQLLAYYTDVFATGRSAYAIPGGALTNVPKQHQLAAFFWWTSWACSTDRPGSDTTYTNNWPHEPLIGNVPVNFSDRLTDLFKVTTIVLRFYNFILLF